LVFCGSGAEAGDFGSILPEKKYSAVVFDEAHEMKTWPADYSGADFEFPGLRAGAERSNDALRIWAAIVLRKTQRSGNAARLFRIVSTRDGRFSFLRNEREAFLEQNREVTMRWCPR